MVGGSVSRVSQLSAVLELEVNHGGYKLKSNKVSGAKLIVSSQETA